jgi:ATP-dependent helicase/nuclease subunit A
MSYLDHSKDTHEQMLAMALDRHLAVTANAGSGKTRVLVNRYIEILISGGNTKLPKFSQTSEVLQESHVSPKHIAAITFTRKAAAEMHAKIVKQVDEFIAKATKRSELEELTEIREKLSSARISTIHSFCSDLLRQFPIEAGINPAFSEISTAELLSIQFDKMTEVFVEWLESKDESIRKKALDVFRIFGREKLERLIKDILNKRGMIANLKQFYSNTDEDILILRDQILSDYINNTIFPAMEVLAQIFENVDNTVLGKAVEKFIEAHSSLMFILENNRSELYDISKILEIFSNAGIVVNNLYTNDLTVYKSIAKGFASDSDIEIANQQGTKFTDLFTLIEALKNAEYDQEMIRLSRILIELAETIQSKINDEKNELGYIDFDDMLMLTHELLKNPEVCIRLSKKIKYLLVDEFQDTDFVQYEIIRMLVPDLNSDVECGTNLFIVGDAKQSIYGFRNADVRVFEQARKEIINRNKRLIETGLIDNLMPSINGSIESSAIDSTGDLKLSVTFRLQPVVASFVNMVCGRIMSDRESEYDVGYTTFIIARNTAGIEKLADGVIIEDTDNLGSISFLITEKPPRNHDQETEEDNETKEARLTALFIKQIVTGKSGYQVEENGVFRNAGYGDIAVLGRKKSIFGELARELLKLGIPNFQHTGSGFFQTQEITDIISFLKCIHNPKDSLALLSILRSPFFALSDTVLYLLSNQKGNSYWEKLDSLHNLILQEQAADNSKAFDKNEIETIKRAVDILKEIFLIAPGVSLPELIQSILERSSWYGTVPAFTGEAKMTANMDKFIAYARSFEGKGTRTLSDFIEELDFIIENEIDESEADTEPVGNAVNLMTVHASKGLEFPIVILYGTNTRGNRSNEVIVNESTGINFPVPGLKDAKFETYFNSPLYELTKTRQLLIEKAEEKRILYVAATRAKDHLVISTTLNKTKDGIGKLTGMIDMICTGLEMEGIQLSESEDFVIHDDIEMLLENKVVSHSLNYNVRIFKNFTDEDGLEVTETINETQPALILPYIMKTNIEGEYYSASKLMMFMNDREEYISRYLLGMPVIKDAELSSVIPDSGDDNDSITGSLAGSIIHQVLENMSGWVGYEYMNEILNEHSSLFNTNELLDFGRIVDRQKLELTINEIIQNNQVNINKAFFDRVVNESSSIISTQLLQKYFASLKTSRRETELTMPIGNDFITGKIDLMIPDNEGNWEVWDWKTNKVESAEQMDFLFNEYQLQLKMYAFFLSQLYNEQQKFTVRLLFTRMARPGAADESWTRKEVWNKEDIAKFSSEIKNMVAEMAEFSFGLER